MASRSVLFTPGHRRGMLEGALASDADAVVADLEDGCPPADRSGARSTIVSVLEETPPESGPTVLVRINPLATDGRADIEGLAPLAGSPVLAGVVLPKVDGPSTVTAAQSALAEAGLSRELWCLIESPAGVLAAADIAACEGVGALVFGGEDYMAAVGGDRTEANTEVLYARQHVVAAAAAAGIDAIDGITADIEDTDRVAADAAEAATFGFDGKLAIHPAQLDPIAAAFTPDDERVAWARRVVEAAEAADGGAIRVDGEMIDAPLVARARSILEAAGDR